MTKNSLVLYKSTVAIVLNQDGDKYQIKFCSQPASPGGKKAVYGEQKVREKDVVLLHEGPVSSLENVLSFCDEKIPDQLNETYELLLSDEGTASESISISDLAEYARGEWNADHAWAFYSALSKDVHFELSDEDYKNGKLFYTLRTQEEIDSINQKNYEKEHEAEIRTAFISRLKNKKLDLPADAKYMGEVEAYALNKTDKCKTMAEAGFSYDKILTHYYTGTHLKSAY